MTDEKYLYVTTTNDKYFGKWAETEGGLEGIAISVREDQNRDMTANKMATMFVKSTILGTARKVTIGKEKIESRSEAELEQNIIGTLQMIIPEAKRMAEADALVIYLEKLAQQQYSK